MLQEYYIARLEVRKQFVVALSLLTVIGWNFITWLPYFSTYLMLTLDVIEAASPIVSAVMYVFLYSSTGFNTMLYAARCPDIRQEVVALVTGRGCTNKVTTASLHSVYVTEIKSNTVVVDLDHSPDKL